jgi:hypothetical protein
VGLLLGGLAMLAQTSRSGADRKLGPSASFDRAADGTAPYDGRRRKIGSEPRT